MARRDMDEWWYLHYTNDEITDPWPYLDIHLSKQQLKFGHG